MYSKLNWVLMVKVPKVQTHRAARPQVTDSFFLCGFPLSVDSIYMESRTMDHSNSW